MASAVTPEHHRPALLDARPSGAPRRLGGAGLKLWLAGGAVVCAVLYLVVVGLQSSTVYFLTVPELLGKGNAAQGQIYRVSGNLVPGSLAREASVGSVRFNIADPVAQGAGSLPVVYHGGQIPDIVGDNVEIVAEGKLDGAGTFQANTVLAKCPSRLENAPPEEHDYSGPGGGAATSGA